ncbi:MAG: ATP-binding protein, partial [Candidatus Omnitrophota bacterium]
RYMLKRRSSYMYIPRYPDLNSELKSKSIFLFGPRQTGKSWLINKTLSEYRVYDLLDNEVYLTLSRDPKRLEEELRENDKIIIIDEVQKLPFLLNEVHRIIEKYGIHFLLTGSSARKLRRGGINLLGGRARSKHLHPFVFRELKERFDLLKALNYGSLPSIWFSDSPEEDLKAYAGNYLKEEIAAEGLTRNVPAFSRFLEVAALCNGKMINFSNISNDAQVPCSTVQEYFHILRDTLIGFDVPAWKKTVKRKPISTSKFYFFDVGVVRHLQNRSQLKKGSPEFGDAFETYLAHELRTYVDYNNFNELCYWRSKSGYEVDFIIDDILAVEIKAKENVSSGDIRGIAALKEEGKIARYVVVSLEKRPRHINGIHILPWEDFLTQLWEGILTSS